MISLMFTAFFIGNIASGKSSATRYLVSKGAIRLDLDQMAKDLYVPGSSMNNNLADQFGRDVLDSSGAVRRDILASRAFVSKEAANHLNSIVYPLLYGKLERTLDDLGALKSPPLLVVVENSNAAAFTDSLRLADEVVAISVPLEVRRERALRRGMALDDFERRASLQPDEDVLCQLAGTVISNLGDPDELYHSLDAWLDQRGLASLLVGSESSDHGVGRCHG